MSFSDDDLLFDDDEGVLVDDENQEDSAHGSTGGSQLTWRVLVVDDEPDVLLMTRLALQSLTVDGMAVQLHLVGSAAEARRFLAETPDVAVAIVDVTMEDLTAGLDLVRWIRDGHGDSNMRLVLRTGQPGNTPEAQVTAQYDIHDYLGKAETTARRLMTCVIGAIRAWRDIWTIRRQRQGLQRALRAVGQLFDTPGLRELLAAILDQVTALLLPRRSSLLLLGLEGSLQEDGGIVLAATGKYAATVGRAVPEVLDDAILRELQPQLVQGGVVRTGELVGYVFELAGESRPLLLIDGGPLQPWEQELVELYCHSVALALRNRSLWEQQLSWYRAMQRFVPRELTGLVGKADLREIRAGDSSSQSMAVCFVDVRQFSQLVLREGSDRAFRLLNELFADLGQVVARHGGVIDKYMGDGALVLFPGGRGALLAAVQMQLRCEALRQAAAPGQPQLRMGIGLHCGEITVGAVGHDERMDISVVSQVVNLTSRVQEVARNFTCDIVLTDELAAELDDAHRQGLRPLLVHLLRGAEQPVRLWECMEHLPQSVQQARLQAQASLQAATALAQQGRWAAVVASLAPHVSADETCHQLHAYAIELTTRHP